MTSCNIIHVHDYTYFFTVIHVYAGKFGGAVSGKIQMPVAVMLLSNTFVPTTASDSNGLGLTALDIITYTILAVAGFLSTLFFVALCCTICICCSRKRKRNRLDIDMQ